MKEQHIFICQCWGPDENGKTEGDVNPCKAQATKKEKEKKKFIPQQHMNFMAYFLSKKQTTRSNICSF